MVKISKNPSKIHTPNNEMQSHRPSFYKRDTSYPARTKPRQRRSGLRIEACSFRGIRLCPECVPSLCKRLRKYTFYFQERESDRTKISACENTVIILMYRYSSSPAAFRTTPRSLRRDGNRPGRLLYESSGREKIHRVLRFEVLGYPQKRDGNKESLTDTTQEHTDKGAMEYLRPTYDRSLRTLENPDDKSRKRRTFPIK